MKLLYISNSDGGDSTEHLIFNSHIAVIVEHDNEECINLLDHKN